MSVVTNVIVTGRVGCTPCNQRTNSVIVGLNAWLSEQNLGELADVGQHAGGTKHLETQVWCGAFNYLPLEAFVERLEELLQAEHLRHWRGDRTGWPQLFVQGDQEGWFREIPLQILGTRT